MNFALPAMALAAWLGATSVDPNTGASWVGGVAALSLLTIAIGFNVRQYRNQAKEIQQLKIDRAKDKRECNWQISVLAEVLDANDIPMPGRFWDVPEDPILTAQLEETDRRRRMFKMRYEDRGEDGAVAMNVVGIVLLVASFVAVLLVLANSLIIQPIQDINSRSAQSVLIREQQLENDRKDSCIASLTADYFVAIADAFSSPPSPDPKRTVAVDNLNTTAERIRNRVKLCKDGKPDDFVPETVPTSTPGGFHA